MDQDNNTLFVEQNEKKAQVSNVKVDNKKKAMIVKLLSSAGIGMAIGTGLSFTTEDSEPANEQSLSDVVANELIEQESDEVAASTENQPTHSGPSAEERISALEENEQIRQQQEEVRQQQEEIRQQREEIRQQQEEVRQQQEEVRQQQEEIRLHQESNFLQDHDVKIESVQEVTLDDGSIVHLYIGEADGHEAAFLDDGEYIVRAVIDVDDNGDIEDNDVMDLRSYQITIQQMAEVCENQTVDIDSDINVISVNHDVDIQGQLVDVAVVEVDGQRVALVDMDHDNIVDVAIADINNDGQISDEEITDFREYNMQMPIDENATETGTGTADLADYTNNADVDVYDV